MKVRKVGRDFTKKRIEIDLERRDGSVVTVLEEHWSLETDPLRMAAEATVWLRESELPDMLTADCSLSARLRSDHGVKLDSVNYFAGRVIDQWVELDLRPSIPAAIDLGMAYALFHVYRQRDPPREKPRQPKDDVWSELIKYLSDARNNKEEAWSSTPEPEENELRIEVRGDHWLVYRDGEKLCAVNKRTKVEKSIKRATFFKYFTRKVSA